MKTDAYFGLFEEAQEAELLWPEDQERVAFAVDASSCSAHSVDVLLRTGNKASSESESLQESSF